MIKDKVRKMSYEELSNFYKRNRKIFLISGLMTSMLIVTLMVINSVFGVYFFTFLLWFVIIYYMLYLRGFNKGIAGILTEELAIKRYIQSVGLLKPDSLVLPTLNYAYAHLVAGDWEKTEQYLGRLKEKKLRRAIRKLYIILYWHIDAFLKIIQKKEVDLEQLASQFDSLKIKKEKDKLMLANRLAFLQAMADIESGKVNAYFETAEARHRLERLIFDYYLGRNALLEGKEAEAREQFEKVAQTNKDDIYFVRQAKKYLEELENDAGKISL